MGKPKTPEHRAKIRAAMTGRKRSEADRAAMAERMLATWADPDERARMIAAFRKRKPRVSEADWTPQHSRNAVHSAVRSGTLPWADHCSTDPSHPGPFHYDHCGDPPYSRDNRLVVQPLCSACHVELSKQRRAGRGYRNRVAQAERPCSFCGEMFVVANSRRLGQERVFCCWEHYLRGR